MDGPDLSLPRWGRLRVLTREVGREGLLPAKVLVHPVHGADPFSRAPFTGFSAGEVVLDHAPGPVTVVACRGFEYQIAVREAVIPEDGEAEISLELEPIAPDRDWISGDLHVHTEVSVDSEALVEDRLINYAAEGVDLLVATDHDAATDLSGLIRPLGLEGWLRTAVGIEVSPLYGHTNGFPLQVEGLGSDRWRSYWPIAWNLYQDDGEFVRAFEPPEIFASLRRDTRAAVVQVNHPRSFQGLFDYAHFSPQRGLAGVDPTRLDASFNAFEVFNGKRIESMQDTLPDWYAMLNEGHRIAATGNSDSHAANQEAGYPRNLVPVDSQDLESLDLGQVWEAVTGMRSVVCGGPLLRVDAQAQDAAMAGPGDLLEAPGGELNLHVMVRAAEFVQPSRGQVIVNGQQQAAFEVPPGEGPMRLDLWQGLSLDRDSWIVVLVEGEQDLSPVVPGEMPVALSNPIYVDVDGDGQWSAPGI